MVATAILLVILGVVVGMISQTGSAWTYASEKVSAFQGARFAFETITRAVSHATLNTYYDYYDQSRNRRTPNVGGNAKIFLPDVYGRYSELEFVSGKSLVPGQITHSIFFQTPAGDTQDPETYEHLGGLLNVFGFFLEFGSDSDARPSFLGLGSPPRYRFRLVELLQPTENFSVYENLANASDQDHTWFTDAISSDPKKTVRLLAENIIACVICPRLATDATASSFTSSLSPNFEYDSVISLAKDGPAMWAPGTPQPANMNQLPPVVRIVLIAVDERSMARLQGTSTAKPNLGFDYGSVFQSADKLDDDLKEVSDALSKKRLNFRIFQTDVAISAAKWNP